MDIFERDEPKENAIITSTFDNFNALETNVIFNEIMDPEKHHFPQFQPVHAQGRLKTESSSPIVIEPMPLKNNRFNSINLGVIPGPVSLRCDSSQFIQSWIKYIFQSAICVIFHSVSFILTILWIRFLFSSYLHYEYFDDHKSDNNISHYQQSIVSFLPFSSWIWMALCFTNLVFFLGFTIQTVIIPIQWNFEDPSNSKIFRLCSIIYCIIIIILTFSSYIFQFSYPQFYYILNITLISIVMIWSFLLLLVIIKNGQNNNNNNNSTNNLENQDIYLSSAPSSLQSSPVKQVNNNTKSKHIYININKNIITTFSNNYSSAKLIIICVGFAIIISLIMVYLYINFNYLFPFISRNQSHSSRNHCPFFIVLSITLFSTLFCGDFLVFIIKVLMKIVSSLLLDISFGNRNKTRSMSWSYNIHYGSMQSFNRMILFAIPLIFISKITTFIMIYSFVNIVEFTISVIVCCIISRCLNYLFQIIEEKLNHKLNDEDEDINSDGHDDEISISKLQNYQLAAQCSYIHDIILYIATLLVPITFCLFGLQLNNEITTFKPLYYLETLLIQFTIQSIFDLFPLLIILFEQNTESHNSHSGQDPYSNFYRLSRNSPISTIEKESSNKQPKNYSVISKLSMNLKIHYINMMNGWTATDKCVRHFMWWCTIFIGGYFVFYFLYPQQFLCATHEKQHSIIFNDWTYIQCQ